MKIKWIVTILLSTFISLNVHAKEYLTYDWSLNQGDSWWDAINWSHTTELDDGYLITTLDGEGYGIMRNISKDGKQVIWEQPNDYGYFYGSAIKHKEFIYCLYLDPVNGTYLGKYDLKGNLVNEIHVNSDTENYNPYIYGGELIQKNEKLYIIFKSYIENIPGAASDTGYGPKYLYTVDIENFTLEKKEDYWQVDKNIISQITDSQEELMSETLNDIYKEDGSNVYIYHLLVKDNHKYFIGQIYNDNYSKGIIVKTDMSNKIEWVKKSEDDNIMYYTGTYLGNDYVAITTANISSEKYPNGIKSEIRVYDTKGNLVETHNLPQELNTANGDVITFNRYGDSIVAQVITSNNNTIQSHVVRYTINYEISKKVNGDGSIQINETAQAGEKVTFSINPGTNSILTDIKIKDEAGNEIKYTDNAFIMPKGNVTIEANFATVYNIITEIDANGKIEIAKTAIEGEEVSFNASAKQGYEIKSIKAITNDGKTIDIKNNKFIMPSDDVYITVEIGILQNPTTGIISHLMIILSVTLISGVSYIMIKNKKLFKQI